MGISRRQDRTGRNAGNGADPRIERGTGHCGQGGMPRAFHIRLPQLRAIPSFDAALSVPALGRDTRAPGTRRHQMGETARVDRQPRRLSHARGRLAPAADAARSVVSDFIADEKGATAIEYGLIAALISVAIIGALSQLSGQMDAMYNSIVQAMP